MIDGDGQCYYYIDPADSKYQPVTNNIKDTKESKHQTVYTFLTHFLGY